jgi:hypothetical protein
MRLRAVNPCLHHKHSLEPCITINIITDGEDGDAAMSDAEQVRNFWAGQHVCYLTRIYIPVNAPLDSTHIDFFVGYVFEKQNMVDLEMLGRPWLNKTRPVP